MTPDDRFLTGQSVQCLAQPVEEQVAIGEAGQRIVEGVTEQSVFVRRVAR